MKTKQVSRLGERQRIIYLPKDEFEKAQMVSLNPKGSGYFLVRPVLSMGTNLIVTIPKKNWDKFPYHSQVKVRSFSMRGDEDQLENQFGWEQVKK